MYMCVCRRLSSLLVLSAWRPLETLCAISQSRCWQTTAASLWCGLVRRVMLRGFSSPSLWRYCFDLDYSFRLLFYFSFLYTFWLYFQLSYFKYLSFRPSPASRTLNYISIPIHPFPFCSYFTSLHFPPVYMIARPSHDSSRLWSRCGCWSWPACSSSSSVLPAWWRQRQIFSCSRYGETLSLPRACGSSRHSRKKVIDGSFVFVYDFFYK